MFRKEGIGEDQVRQGPMLRYTKTSRTLQEEGVLHLDILII